MSSNILLDNNFVRNKFPAFSENISKDPSGQPQTTFKFEPTISIVSQPADRRISRYINIAVDELKLSNKYLPSGAGHDAQEMTQICPIGMIFIPSKKGISHSPTEYSSPEDITNGANVLLNTVLIIDKQL